MTYENFVERYKDKAYIGSGGFAKVYKVFDYANNQYVALKVADVRPEFKKFTLQNEVELINQIPNHDNIVKYESCYRFNTGITGEMDFAILPYYERGNLEQFLAQQQLSIAEKRHIIIGILRGVRFLHKHDIIHRDLKAQNILIHQHNGEWVPKIADFGLGRNVAGQDSAVSNSSIGVSFEYASPEQIRNGKIYKNVDLWAVGALIFRIISDISPFRYGLDASENNVQSQLEISRRIMALELPQAAEAIQDPYKSIIAKCLVIDPSERASHAQELLTLLGEAEVAGTQQPVDQANDKTEIIKPEEILAKSDEDYSEKTELLIEKTAVLPPTRPKAPQPKQDFQYQPRTNFDLPVYQNPRKNVTQIFAAKESSVTDAPASPPAHKINMSQAEEFNKLWLYLPIFLMLTIGAVWSLYVWLNPPTVIAALAAPEPIAAPVEQPTSAIPAAFLDCYKNGKNQLPGILRLMPTELLLGTFEAMGQNCQEEICAQMESPQSFAIESGNGDACLAPLLDAALQYHHSQIIANSSLAVFYDSGQSSLSIPQKNELNAFLKRYKKNARDYGLLIIGRASNVGNPMANQNLSQRRAESIIDFVSSHYIKNLKTEFIYFGANPPQLTKSIADDYGIALNKYQGVKFGSGNDTQFTLRLNQSVLMVMYVKADDPFDLEQE